MSEVPRSAGDSYSEGRSVNRQPVLPADQQAASGALMMPLSDLQPYEHNPRHGFNAEYQRIKSSIRAQGLDQPLVVTQRPGERHYVPLVGGNTRLKILQELYQETRDERFGTVNCVYRPWTEESQVLLAHLRENELRGSLIFIDKALAVMDLKAILESESPHRTLTLRGLAKIMTQRGLGINHTVISKMVYAVERLLPLIPEALNAGLGRPQVEKLQALENAFLELWYRHALGPESECAEIFAALCQRYDSSDWNLELLRTALENEVAEATDTSLHSVRLQLDALLSGSGYTEVVLEPLATAQEPEVTQPDGVQEQSNSTQRERREGIRPKAAAPFSATVPLLEAPLVSLRVTTYTLAARLAEYYGLAVLVVPLPDQGLGFMLTDVPPPELRDTLDPALFGEVSCLWWQLAACAELTTAPVNQVLPHLVSDSVLHTAVSLRDPGLLYPHVWTPDPGHWGCQLWRSLSDTDWRDLLALMTTYRAIHEAANRMGLDLWLPGEGSDANQ
ncbi:MAG: chromosome partitioning protein ParB [Haliea sp.]|nr:chromosome partitioning protein ParB [Haliea sp.]